MQRPRVLIQGNLVIGIDLSPARGNPDPPPRGDIRGFSKASRKRMIRECAKMGGAVPIFVTLTYPSEWPPDAAQWKSDLDVWWKRVKRLDGNLGAFWRLEPQERGAPHYHLLIYRNDGKRPFLPHKWVSESWADVTSGNPESCSRVEALKTQRGAMFYAAKYCAKLGDGTLPEGWEKVGKHWGRLSLGNLPYAKQHEMILHSGMEQMAALFTMKDAFRNSTLKRLAAGYGDDPSAMYLAQKEWEKLVEENEFFGNTATFFGDAEKFISQMAEKMREIQDELGVKYGKRTASEISSDIDKTLARA